MKYTVTEHVMKNGARGLIVNAPETPVMSTQFHFRAGNRYVRDKSIEQTAHIMEHMAFGANAKFASAHEFDAEFTLNGAYNNAYTSDYGMCYVAECAAFEWDRILDLQRLTICEPRFNQDEFEGEFGNVKSELTGYLNTPNRVLWPRVAQEMGEPTLTFQERLETLPNIKLDDIKEHYKRTHTSGNLRFVIAGDFTGRMTKLRDMLDQWELIEGDRPPIPVDELHSFEPFAIRRKDVSNITFGWSMNISRRLSDDELSAMSCLDHILNGTLHGRIQGQARKRGLVYGIWSDTSPYEHNSSWDFGAEVNVDKANQLFDIIVTELRKIVDGDLSEKEITEAKNYALGRYQMGIQTVGALNNWFANRYFFDGKIEDFDALPERLQSVTRERIIDTMREFFAGNCWGLGLYGNTDKAFAEKLNAKLAKLF